MLPSSPVFGLRVTGLSAGPCPRDPKSPHFAPAAGFCLIWGWHSPLPPSPSSLPVGSPPSGAPRGLQDKPQPSSEWPGPPCPVPPPTPAPCALSPSAAWAALCPPATRPVPSAGTSPSSSPGLGIRNPLRFSFRATLFLEEAPALPQSFPRKALGSARAGTGHLQGVWPQT